MHGSAGRNATTCARSTCRRRRPGRQPAGHGGRSIALFCAAGRGRGAAGLGRSGGGAVAGAAAALAALPARPAADEATLLALAPQLARAGAAAGRACGAWRCGCSGAWARPTTSIALILVVYSLLPRLGAVAGHAGRVFLAFICLVLVPTIVRIASDTSQSLALAAGGHRDDALLRHRADGAHLRQRTGPGDRAQGAHRSLAAQLRIEMTATESRRVARARRAAEAANRAKTQFFAAASHDLRQPLHAMGLFAEALRQRSHDPEVARRW